MGDSLPFPSDCIAESLKHLHVLARANITIGLFDDLENPVRDQSRRDHSSSCQ
jgi:hypothetical protein